ncbi:hypothetical protein BY996DRAFT_663167 [Phakopsora pachyrhizi]|uniref:Secreted protein n=1 Tax=Phakopsora pachyrhizi TaxID=170000 RepID=A0AAV0ANX8_PHAPC|nr:hypothetical protein BY996DRAFT_663167 [Phakopsora pachyrhizi]CAH7670723.1 hypothetical protein PPACK8108_LOCUS5449 [Phakopsora pachyrhizi]
MTISTKEVIFSWGSFLLTILLLQSSGATEAPEAFQWSKIFEEASKIDDKAPLTNVWSLFRDDPINQHELEHNNRIREGRPIPSIESRFNSGENQVKENTGFGDLGNNSGLMGAISDIYSLEHPNIAENC